jgi:hypothetical protein
LTKRGLLCALVFVRRCELIMFTSHSARRAAAARAQLPSVDGSVNSAIALDALRCLGLAFIVDPALGDMLESAEDVGEADDRAHCWVALLSAGLSFVGFGTAANLVGMMNESPQFSRRAIWSYITKVVPCKLLLVALLVMLAWSERRFSADDLFPLLGSRCLGVCAEWFIQRFATIAGDHPSYAFLSAAMSSFFICIMAAMARWDFSDLGSPTRSRMPLGTICHDTPNLSFSQPHCWALGSPPAPSFSQ